MIHKPTNSHPSPISYLKKWEELNIPNPDLEIFFPSRTDVDRTARSNCVCNDIALLPLQTQQAA